MNDVWLGGTAVAALPFRNLMVCDGVITRSTYLLLPEFFIRSSAFCSANHRRRTHEFQFRIGCRATRFA